jgi:hypothetical protein
LTAPTIRFREGMAPTVAAKAIPNVPAIVAAADRRGRFDFSPPQSILGNEGLRRTGFRVAAHLLTQAAVPA